MGNPASKNKDWGFYVKELAGLECQCGRPKHKGRSVCFGCWKRLPGDVQKALYRKLGSGYEEAYEEACAWLNN